MIRRQEQVTVRHPGEGGGGEKEAMQRSEAPQLQLETFSVNSEGRPLQETRCHCSRVVPGMSLPSAG